MQVSELDPVEVQSKVDDVVRENYKMGKAQPLDAVVKALTASLDAFKVQLPLLQEVLPGPRSA